MKLIPREYQLEGIKFLREHKRALLFDDPGMGKTLQAAMAAVKPVLITCPTYLVEQWADFLTEQFPGDVIAKSYEGTAAQRLKALNIPNVQWMIVNTEMLRTYNFGPVRTLIIDESHHVRNRNAKQSKEALKIAIQTEYVYLLTGTPIYKDVDDLFMQLQIIAPRVFTSYFGFVSQFCTTSSTPWGPKIKDVRNIPTVRGMLKRFAIGRSYKDVGLQLPNLIEQVIHIKMPPKLMEAYKKMRAEYRLLEITFANAGALLQALRQATACKEKLEAARSLINDNDHKVRTVVFTWYVDTAHALGTILKAPVITGEIAIADRVKIAKGNHKVIIATLASMSEGVDLSAYKMLVFFEEDYTPGMMHQSLSRVLRYSTNPSPVRAYYLLMKNTVDEIVHHRRLNRNATAMKILEEAING